MVRFSRDVDLLKWEPVLFRELASSSQRLCRSSDGVLNGTTFTSASGLFESCGLSAGKVIYLGDGADIDGCFEVVSVDSDTELTLSVVRESSEDAAVAPAVGGSEIVYQVVTFDPQAEEVSVGLLQYFGLKEEGEDFELTADGILNSRQLRQASVFAVLAGLFAGYAMGGKDEQGYGEKAKRYERLFYESRSKARLEIDIDGDEVADRFKTGGAVRLRRD